MSDSRYDTLLSRFKEVLKQNALKFTAQREAILKTLFGNNEHLAPEELHALVKSQNQDCNIGVSTVYRTLNLLEDAGLVNSLSYGSNGKKYELSSDDHHDHIICVSCDKIIEFEDDVIEQRQEEIATKSGFVLTAHTMQLYGICTACQEKNIDKKT